MAKTRRDETLKWGALRPDHREMTVVGDYFAPTQTMTPPSSPALPPLTPRRDDNEAGFPVRLALLVTGLALLASYLLDRYAVHVVGPDDGADRALRKAVVLTLGFYLVLGLALLLLVTQRGVRFTWARAAGAPAALLLGLPLGAVMGLVGVGINSAGAGHLASDPAIEALVGGGGGLRIGLVLVTTAVLAPLTEEVLFRGILGGALLEKSLVWAVWASAAAFAVWHMSPLSLRYYVTMGLVLAGLWRARGLLASISAHAAFNGVLTVAAVAATGGAGHLTTFQGLAFQVPGGWHAVSDAPSGMLGWEGPAGSGLVVTSHTLPRTVTGKELETAMASGQVLEDMPAPLRTRAVEVDGHPAVEADIRTDGQAGHVLFVMDGRTAYQLVVFTGGSPAAEQDWRQLVRSVNVTGS